MPALEAAAWTVDEHGFHCDPRLSEDGYRGGVTTKAMGSMAEPSARAKALERAGLGHLPHYELQQVHGNAVIELAKSGPSKTQADGWLVHEPGKTAVVYAADCMPIYIWDSRGKAAAVLHSGWKGTKANIAAEGVKALVARGVRASLARAAIGPRIGRCCYAVGEDFAQWARPEALERRGGKLYFDLAQEAMGQLKDAGVPGDLISVSPACTCCGADFFSFRRDKSGARMMAFLARHDARHDG